MSPTGPEKSASSDDTLDLSPDKPPAPVWVWADVAGRTHVGKVRANNEDHFLAARLAKAMHVLASSLPEDSTIRLADEGGYVFMVADGMGGHAGGEKASALAIGSVEQFVLDSVQWFLHLPGAQENTLLQELREGLEKADRTLIDYADTEPRLAGMGTTLTLAFSVGADLYVVHAGDSRAYLYRDGQLDQLTTDHNLAQALVKAGMLTPEAAQRDRRRHVITNVLGGPEAGVHAEIHKVRLQDGDVLLLCTDGLTGPVNDAAVAAALAGSRGPEAACEKLVQLALEGGAPDNVSVVVAHYTVSDKPQSQGRRVTQSAQAAGLFVRLAESAARGDTRAAAAAQEQLRQLGWSVQAAR